VVVTEVVITAVMDSVKMARNRTTEAIETKTDLRIKVECVFPVIIVSILPLAEFGQHDHQEDTPHFRELLESLNIVSSYFAVKSFFPFAYMMIHVSMTHHCMYPFLTVLLSLSSVLYVEILAY